MYSFETLPAANKPAPLNSLQEDLILYSNVEHVSYFDRWIGNFKPQIDIILCDENNYNVIADMYSGKTYSFIKRAHELGRKMIVLQPLQMNVKQKFIEFKKKGITLGYIHGKRKNEGIGIEEITFSDINEMVANDDIIVIMCVYNSLSKLLMSYKFDPSEYILVIDEAHLLTSQYGFRSKEINYILDNKYRFKKVINLSGTPEGAIYNNYTSKVFFNNLIESKKEIEVNIVKYHEYGAYKLFKHAVKQAEGKRIIIVKDDIKQLFNLRAAFAQWGFNDDQIKILSSQDKGSKDFIYIEETEKIPARIRILLTTRVIADGPNIYDTEADVIYFWDVYDFGMKRQFISRFRDGISGVYDFLPYNNQKPISQFRFKETFYDLKKIYEIQKDNLQQLMHLKTELNRTTNIVERSPILSAKEITSEYILLSEVNGQYRVSDEKIMHYLLEKYYESLSLNAEYASDFYINIAGFTANILSYDCPAIKDTSAALKKGEFDKLVNLERSVRKDDEITFIIENFSSVFTQFLHQQNNIILDAHRVDPELIASYVPADKLLYIKRLLSIHSIKKIFNTIYSLSLDGYPVIFLRKVAEMLYWRKNVHYYKQQRILDYYFDSYIYRSIRGVKDLYKINDSFLGYKLIDIILKRIKLTQETVKIEVEKEYLNKECMQLDIDYNWKNYEFSSLINGLFISGKRKQKKSSSKDLQNRKIKYYFYEIKGHRMVPDFTSFNINLAEFPIKRIEMIPYLRFMQKIKNVINSTHLSKKDLSTLENFYKVAKDSLKDIINNNHLI